jgi:hypothetical protein
MKESNLMCAIYASRCHVCKICLIENVSCAQDMTHWKHIMCTNVNFKSESFNTHPTVSDLSYEKVEELSIKK